MAKKEDKLEEDKEEKDNIVEEEKAEEKSAEKDYNSIFDDDYVDEKVKSRPDSGNDESNSAETLSDKEPQKDEEEKETEASTEEAVKDEGSRPADDYPEGETPEEEDKREERQAKGSSKDSSSSKESKSDKKKDKDEKDKAGKEERLDDENKIALDKPERKKKSGSFPVKKILIALAVILALSAGAFGGYLYFKSQNKPKEEQKKTTEEPKKEAAKKTVYVTADGGLNMREDASSGSKSLVVIPNGTKLTVLEEQDGWYKVEYNSQTGWVSRDYVSEESPLVYKNETYGFQLTFPEGWSTYKVVEKSIDNGDGTQSPALYVGIKSADSNYDSTVGKGYADMFAISVLTPAQWNSIKDSEGPKGAYITESSKYVFIWSPSQAGSDDVLDEREQVNDIIKTFKLL